ncbi:hypothetical protein [Tropicimonas sp. S265A]|uniref:hypothetical protein n=1 Tax=Tropicimonas sp. S265A TaxID=3415134 RepID=UPI003C7E3A65
MASDDTAARTFELLREEWTTDKGKELRIVSCRLTPEGGLHVDGYDLGPGVKAFWGDSDYEYGIKLSPEDTRKLLPHLLKLVVTGTEPLSIDGLRKLCDAHGLKPNFWSWV